VRRLAGCAFPEGVRVIDFGIRGFDLACALVDGYEAAILVDAMSQGKEPGSLCVIEPALPDDQAEVELQAHSLDPVKVLALARALGEVCPWLRLVGCEPLTFGSDEEPIMDLSAPVQAAVAEAVRVVELLVANYLDATRGNEETG
jgi:hydrogenase maturation protease